MPALSNENVPVLPTVVFAVPTSLGVAGPYKVIFCDDPVVFAVNWMTVFSVKEPDATPLVAILN